MMLRSVFIVLFCVLGVAAARADTYVRVGKAELNAVFSDVTLIGETARSGISWQTCISKTGQAVEQFEGETLSGDFIVSDDSRACFLYPTGPRCFDVYRRAGTFLLSGTADFKVNEVKPGLDPSCAEN